MSRQVPPQLVDEAAERLLAVAQTCDEEGRPDLAARIREGVAEIDCMDVELVITIVQTVTFEPLHSIPGMPGMWGVAMYGESGRYFGAWTYCPDLELGAVL